MQIVAINCSTMKFVGSNCSYIMMMIVNYHIHDCYIFVASSPGHSHIFNVSHRKGGGPGARAHVSDVAPGIDLITCRHRELISTLRVPMRMQLV